MSSPSILITPNAKKISKLYSVIPTNGTGDLNVVRATTATYVGSDGLIKTALANEPRFDYTNGSCPSILVEPQRTNLVLQSSKFDLSPWSTTNVPIITANTDISPDGTLTAYTLTDTSTTAISVVQQAFNVNINTPYTTSIFIKKTTGVLTSYPIINLRYSGVGTRVSRAIINTNNGTFYVSSSNVGSYSIVIKDYSDYWRVEYTTTDNISNTSLIIQIYPAGSSDGITDDVTATGSAVFWGAQLEAGSNATSYIPTTTTAVTRNADVISKSGISDLIGQTEGTIYCEFISNDDKNWNSGIINLRNSNADERFFIRYSTIPIHPSGGYLGFLIRNNGSNVVEFNTTIIPIKGQKYKVCVTYNQTEQKIFVNGVLEASRTGGYTQPNTIDSMQLAGIIGSSNISNTSFNSALIIKNVISDAEAIQLTTL